MRLSSFIVLVMVAMSCRPKETVGGVKLAYTLRGSLSLIDNPSTEDLSMFGDVDLLLYSNQDDGYCDRGASALVASAPRMAFSVTAQRLASDPLTFTVDVVEEPEQKYPITFYPVAVLRVARDPNIACLEDGGTRRFSGYGFTKDATPNSTCLRASSPITVTAAGQQIGGLDLVMRARPAPEAGCSF